MPKVPIALIRHLCYQSSYRLPKLERIQFPEPMLPKPKPYHANRATNLLKIVQGATRPVILIPAGFPSVDPSIVSRGNLPNDEYRYYVGKMSEQYLFATCRFCEAVIGGPVNRKNHETGYCKENLLIIYRLLREKGNCVVCDKKTNYSKWGIPLCTIPCENEWRFSIPGAFKFERQHQLDKLKESADA